MPSMDFIYDIIDCLSKERMDYLILTIRDGKEKDKVDLFYNFDPEKEEIACLVLDTVRQTISESNLEKLDEQEIKLNNPIPPSKPAKKKRGRPRKKKKDDESS